MIFQSNKEADFSALCEALTVKYPHKKALFLTGELGTGKTTFSKQFLKHLGSSDEAQSPTFILHREYVLPSGKLMHHLDLYRIKNTNELAELKLEKIAWNDDYVLIEWADLYDEILSDIFENKGILRLIFDYGEDESTRQVEIVNDVS